MTGLKAQLNRKLHECGRDPLSLFLLGCVIAAALITFMVFSFICLQFIPFSNLAGKDRFDLFFFQIADFIIFIYDYRNTVSSDNSCF